MIGMTDKQNKRPRLTAKKKFEIYLATRAKMLQLVRSYGKMVYIYLILELLKKQ